jgi:DNA adenine methylase
VTKKIAVPPIKTQGIKTRLVPRIQKHLVWHEEGVWIEPFLGSGVVGFNIRPKRAIFADSNPHIIRFYAGINANKITSSIVREFLTSEGSKLAAGGADYYYQVRERFNEQRHPLDFLFLVRAGFNGLIRFNQSGGFNVPFNHKPERFAPAYVTKVVNQVQYVSDLCQMNEYEFVCQDFRQTFASAEPNDFVYCDPPYAGRHVDYFNHWDAQDEGDLLSLLRECPCHFMLSTWHSNQYRENLAIADLERYFHVSTHEHFYHVGAKETNRHPMVEALVTNYPPQTKRVRKQRPQYMQARLFESSVDYES